MSNRGFIRLYFISVLCAFYLYYSINVNIGSCPPTLLFNGYWVSGPFLWGQSGQSMIRTPRFHLMPSFRISGAILPFPYMPLQYKLAELCLYLNLLLSFSVSVTTVVCCLESALCTVRLERDFMRWSSVMWCQQTVVILRFLCVESTLKNINGNGIYVI